MGVKAPIFTRSLRSFRSLSWGDHSDHPAEGIAQFIQVLKLSCQISAGRALSLQL